MNMADLKSNEATETVTALEKPALAECARVLASTLLLGCQTRGRLDAPKPRDARTASDVLLSKRPKGGNGK
jgi:hypothetical protein